MLNSQLIMFLSKKFPLLSFLEYSLIKKYYCGTVSNRHSSSKDWLWHWCHKIRPFVQPATPPYIYNILVQQHFSYCSVVWKIAVKRYQKMKPTKTLETSCSHCYFLQLWCWCWVLMTTITLERSDRSASNSRSINDALQTYK